ncbi:MAG: glutathione S-transferase N-terminal domain-containing protein [Woeseiaceae bacterium]|nr:glutathione S-transferase N-terminal domain-containing protein [Woeseiaceae bacterium]
MDIEARDALAELLKQTGQAHHQAFLATDGADPEWPIWYADYARDKLAESFGMEFTKSQLIYCLMNAEIEHQARAPESPWPQFYAGELLTRCMRSESATTDKLALYHFGSCPFCRMVRSAIDELEIDVELRDIMQSPEHRDDLIGARGRATVPVLRITSPDGTDRWMPESRDIVRYLQETYGE